VLAQKHDIVADIPGLRRAPLEIAELGFNRSFDDMTIKEVSRLQHLMHLSRNVKESRKLQVKLQQRISLPFASVIFSSVGSLLSLRLPAEHKQVGLHHILHPSSSWPFAQIVLWSFQEL
jgi:hypothetical protein